MEETLKKPGSVYLGLTAFAVLLHFWLSPFYPESWDVGPMREALNVFMAVGIVAALVHAWVHKRRLMPDASTMTQLWVHAAFYAAVLLAVLFFWNWFDHLAKAAGDQSQTHLNYWVVINTLYIVLSGTLSYHLWRE